MFQAKHVKLSGELLGLRQTLPSSREKLPGVAANMSVRARTYIEIVRAPQAPARDVSPIKPVKHSFKEHICPESN